MLVKHNLQYSNDITYKSPHVMIVQLYRAKKNRASRPLNWDKHPLININNIIPVIERLVEDNILNNTCT